MTILTKTRDYVRKGGRALARSLSGGFAPPVPASKTTHLWIARHGQTVANREGRFCGHSETELTDFGRQQACALRERLSAITFSAAYTSDYSRAIETAAIVLDGREITPAVDSDLREIHYGEWELQKESEMRRRFPEQHRLMRQESPEWQPPGGETLPLVRERAVAALRAIGARHRGEHVLIVSHGTAIACMLAEALSMAQTHTLRLETANCGLSHVIMSGERFGLDLLNETHFLPAPPRAR